MTKTPLCKLFEKYGADKCPTIHHSYSPEYYRLFEPMKDSVRSLIEIGIGTKQLMDPIVGTRYNPGASLRAWGDFFPVAQIIGLDIEKSVFFQTNKIQCYYMDQSCPKSIINTIKAIKNIEINIVIDDGSHVVDHMITSYKTIKNFLAPGGLYIIEDIQVKDLQDFIDLPKHDEDISIEYIHKGIGDWDSFVAYRKNT